MVNLFVRINLIVIVLVCVNSHAPTIKIHQGILRGQYLETVKGRTFRSFTGIPYAKPPTGILRFEVSRPAEKWNGILDATKPHAVCPQSNIFVGDSTMRGDEDCLYLNVYTPQSFIKTVSLNRILFHILKEDIKPRKTFEIINGEISKLHTCLYRALNKDRTSIEKVSDSNVKLLPVMIFFHGGAYLTGDANRDSYNPSILLDKDIILVVPNYRLGPLGFLSTGDNVVPGNNGLKDQNLAIKWVKANIAEFGGNPERITLFGQSAGGASAHFHMLSPMSRDLINGVICESGTAFSRWALAPNDEGQRNFRKLAQFLNCSSESNREMVKCLRKLDAYEITRQQDKFYDWTWHPLAPFKPVIEPNIKGSFLPAHPANIIESGKAANIPFITGINTEDGAFESAAIFGKPQLLEEFNEDFEELAPITVLYDDKNGVSERLRRFYFGDKQIGNFSKKELTDMCTDGIDLSPTNDAVRLHLSCTEDPVYYYVFGYRGTVSFSSIYGDPFHDYGVCHGDELIYLFPMEQTFPNYIPSVTDNSVAEIVTTLWTNFATFGNPTPTTSSLIPEKWEPVKSEDLEYFFIKSDHNVKMDERLYWKRAEFWKNLLTNQAA